MPDEVQPFLEDMWKLVSEDLHLLAPVQLLGARGRLLPGLQNGKPTRASTRDEVDTNYALSKPYSSICYIPYLT